MLIDTNWKAPERCSRDMRGLLRPRVYVASPVTSSGWVIHNLRNAIDTAEKISAAGFLPYLPQLAIFWDLVHPEHDYKFWLYHITLPWLAVCKYMIRLPGESFGADEEEATAKELGIPVFYSVEEFLKWVIDKPE